MKQIIALIIIVFVFFGILSFSRYCVIQMTMQTEKLNNEYKNLINSSIRTKFLIEELSSLKRLEAMAFDSFNLKYPSGEDYESDNKKYSQR